MAGLHLFKILLLSTSHSPPRKSDFSNPVTGIHLFRNLLLSTSNSPPRKLDFSTPVGGLHLSKNLLLSDYHSPPRKNEFLQPGSRASSEILYHSFSDSWTYDSITDINANVTFAFRLMIQLMIKHSFILSC